MMDAILWLSFFILLMHVYVRLLGRKYYMPVMGDAIHFATTVDGWRLTLLHYIPTEQKHPVPILLMHGLGANRYNMDYGQGVSIARHLRDLGFDVWVGEMRGRGLSYRPDRGRHFYTWNFDDYNYKDIPALIDRVCELTGAPEIDYLGHSMGGILLYSYLITTKQTRIRRGVTVGSPIHFGHVDELLRKLARLRGILRFIPFIPIRWFVIPTLPLHASFRTGFVKNQVNPDNVSLQEVARLGYNLICNLSPGEIGQFAEWIGTDGKIRSTDGSFVFIDHLPEVKTPILLLAGAGDQLVSIHGVKHAYELIGSEDKKYVELSKANGYQHDYGHGDLLIGNSAPAEVFPLIVEWIAKDN